MAGAGLCRWSFARTLPLLFRLRIPSRLASISTPHPGASGFICNASAQALGLKNWPTASRCASTASTSGRVRQLHPIQVATQNTTRSRVHAHKDNELDTSLESPPAEDLQYTRGAALRLLSHRMYTQHEMETKLRSKGCSEEAIFHTLTYLQEIHLQCDRQYSSAYARMKWRTSQWAPYRITVALKQKGVSDRDIEAGLAEAFGHRSATVDDNNDDDEGNSWMGDLMRAAEMQWQRSAGKPKETRHRRMIGWLQRRGHSWDVVYKVLDKLE